MTGHDTGIAKEEQAEQGLPGIAVVLAGPAAGSSPSGAVRSTARVMAEVSTGTDSPVRESGKFDNGRPEAFDLRLFA